LPHKGNFFLRASQACFSEHATSLLYSHRLYPTDRNSMIGYCMAFTEWYYVHVIVSLFKNFYQASH
jgi:hypothetical protein